MKKLAKYLCMVALVICATVVFNNTDVSAAKATKIKRTYKKAKGGKYYQYISGYTKKGKKVWRYKTAKYIPATVESVNYKKRKTKVYIFDRKKIVALKLSSGKKLWTKKTKITAGHAVGFDSKQNMYLVGCYYDDVYKISNKGKILWHTKVKNKEYALPFGPTYKKGVVTVYYEIGPNTDGMVVGKKYAAKIKFDAETGKIKSYYKGKPEY